MKILDYVKKHKVKCIIIVTLFLLAIGILSFFLFCIVLKGDMEQNKIFIVTLKDIKIDLYSEVPKNNDFIVSVKDGNNNESIDFDIEDFKIKYLDHDKKKTVVTTDEVGSFLVHVYSKKYEVDKYVNLMILDRKAPDLELKEVTINEGSNYQVNDFIATCSDNSKRDCIVSFKEDRLYLDPGSYDVVIVAKDESDNMTEMATKLTIQGSENKKDKLTKTSKGYKVVTKNGITTIDGILIVNKTYSLSSSYGSGLTKETMDAYNKMKQDAGTIGININIVSGYRSYDKQKTIYNNYVNRDGKEDADTYSARPGHSEHQSGLAFDLNWIDTAFKDTLEGKWLNENAYKYGFILRYPEGKTNETGYIFEPWHYRYVGADLATKLYNDGSWITLENYFGITSSY